MSGSEEEERKRPVWQQALLLYLLWSCVLGVAVPIGNSLPFKKAPTKTAADLSPQARDVEFPTEDGLVLRGLYAPPEPGRPLLVLQHGVRANRDDLLPWGKIFHVAGYGVLLFDWRAHGASDGARIGYGMYGALDVRAAVRWIEAQPELRGVEQAWFAASMGAASTQIGAGELPDTVRCMVLDSPYGSLPRMIDFRLSLFGPLRHLPAQLLKPVARAWSGQWPSQVLPEESLKAFAPRPLMVMHGTADDTVPVREGVSVYAAYPGPKRAWFTPGDTHTESRVTRVHEWVRRVAEFLHENLQGAPDPEVVLRRAPWGRKERRP